MIKRAIIEADGTITLIKLGVEHKATCPFKKNIELRAVKGGSSGYEISEIEQDTHLCNMSCALAGEPELVDYTENSPACWAIHLCHGTIMAKELGTSLPYVDALELALEKTKGKKLRERPLVKTPSIDKAFMNCGSGEPEEPVVYPDHEIIPDGFVRGAGQANQKPEDVITPTGAPLKDMDPNDPRHNIVFHYTNGAKQYEPSPAAPNYAPDTPTPPTPTAPPAEEDELPENKLNPKPAHNGIIRYYYTHLCKTVHAPNSYAPKDLNGYYTAPEAAEKLGITVSRLYNAMNQFAIKWHHFEGTSHRVRFTEKALADFKRINSVYIKRSIAAEKERVKKLATEDLNTKDHNHNSATGPTQTTISHLLK